MIRSRSATRLAVILGFVANAGAGGRAVAAETTARGDGAAAIAPSDSFPTRVAFAVGRSFALAAARAAGVRALDPNDPLSTVSLRGFGGERVLIVDDLSPVDDFRILGVDGPALDSQLASLEVLRGPRSLRYGPGAIGGVVRVRTLPLDPDVTGLRATATGFGSSDDDGAGGGVRVQGAGRDVSARLTAVGQHAGDLRTMSGVLDGSGRRSFEGEAAAAYRREASGVEARVLRTAGNFDLPIRLDAASAGTVPLRRELDETRVQLVGRHRVSNVDLTARLQSQQRTLDAALGGGPWPAMAFRSSSTSLELTGEHAAGRTSTIVGAGGQSRTRESRGGFTPIPDTRVVSGGAFAIEEMRFDRWTTGVGGRLDFHHTEANESPALALSRQSVYREEWSGTASISWAASDTWTFGGVIARGWRPPDELALYARGPRPLGFGYELGDRTLRSERVVGEEISARGTFQGVAVEARAFVDQVAGWIELEPTDEFRDGLPVYRFAARRALLYGEELALRWQPIPGGTLRGAVESVRGEDRDHDRPLSFVGAPRWIVGGDWVRSFAGPLSQIRVGATVEATLPRREPGPLDTRLALPTEGTTLVHLETETTWTANGVPIRIGLGVRNVTDVEYFESLGSNPAVASGRRRGFVLRVSTGETER